jgi:hypothetical protein
MAANFPNLPKDVNFQMKKLRKSSRKHSKKTIPRQHNPINERSLQSIHGNPTL